MQCCFHVHNVHVLLMSFNHRLVKNMDIIITFKTQFNSRQEYNVCDYIFVKILHIILYPSSVIGLIFFITPLVLDL